uniref:Ig-like domain-containing protein n=1 Tax=Mola mola TaxID=94237 RepID=A0A3Q3XGE7_MOLML
MQAHLVLPPTLELDIRDKMMVKVGNSCTLSGRYSGKPAPSITWTKNDEELKKKHVYLLELYSVTRKESGDYTITAENINGTKYATIKVKVLGNNSTSGNSHKL